MSERFIYRRPNRSRKSKAREFRRISKKRSNANKNRSHGSKSRSHGSKSRSHGSKSRSNRSSKLRKFIRTRASRKISNMMITNRTKIQSRFLNAVCANSGACLVFGRETNKIKKFFNGFSDFTYATDPIKRIGQPSKNGFIYEINYENSGYKSFAVLKSSVVEDADNLYYEYIVGQYLNKKGKYFPCFVETYGLYKYKEHDAWNNMKKRKNVSVDMLKKGIEQLDANDPDMIKTSCKSSKYLAILIQHFEDVETLADKVEKLKGSEFFIQDTLPTILYQVYATLDMLKYTLTHNDLHDNNILLYKVPNNNWIEFRYHYPDGSIVSFVSEYIPKIIDYGRCYFHDSDQLNSKVIHKSVCAETECGSGRRDRCGDNQGYANLNIPVSYPGFYYISAHNRNMSIDLRILQYLQVTPGKNTKTDNRIKILFGMITPFMPDIYTPFGVKENTKSGINNIDTLLVGDSRNTNKINNVGDAHIALKKLIVDSGTAFLNLYSNTTINKSVGILNVYLDQSKEMEFIPL